MKNQRRWLTSVLAASAEPQAVLPWSRGARRRPAVLKQQLTAIVVLTPAQARKAAALRSIAAR